MSDKGRSRTFFDPIALPDGGELRTLRDAATYITKLPKREHEVPAWRAAIQALMLVAEHGGDTMLPRIGIMPALCPGETARPFSADVVGHAQLLALAGPRLADLERPVWPRSGRRTQVAF